MLAGALEFQRDMISENTKEGAAAEAAGKTLGRPAGLAESKAADVVGAYAKGAAVKALARQYGDAPRTVRRVLDAAGARGVPEELGGVACEVQDQEQAPEQPHTIDVPGLLADHLQDTRDATVHEALRCGRTIRRGQGLLGARHRFAHAPPGRAGAVRRSCRRRLHPGRTQGVPRVCRPDRCGDEVEVTAGFVRDRDVRPGSGSEAVVLPRLIVTWRKRGCGSTDAGPWCLNGRRQ
ncbi:hypothetical protein [Streptomyces sp. NPDC059850]|uniref:hypothetical protein n=1 Tax=Streptomyces sp. NPDC059850 TaxID=3346970 RepID=UPI003660E10D